MTPNDGMTTKRQIELDQAMKRLDEALANMVKKALGELVGINLRPLIVEIAKDEIAAMSAALTMPEQKLIAIVKNWMAKYRVSCPESIYQADRVQQGLHELADAVCGAVGYDPDDE